MRNSECASKGRWWRHNYCTLTWESSDFVMKCYYRCANEIPVCVSYVQHHVQFSMLFNDNDNQKLHNFATIILFLDRITFRTFCSLHNWKKGLRQPCWHLFQFHFSPQGDSRLKFAVQGVYVVLTECGFAGADFWNITQCRKNRYVIEL